MPPKATPSTKSTIKSASPVSQLIKVIKTQQFYWFLGHVFALLFSLLSTLTGLIFRNESSLKYFRFALISNIITYGIVIKQIHFKSIGAKFSRVKLINDENVQYLILALVFLLSSYILKTQTQAALYPYFIFGVFHVVTYFQNHLITIFIPSIQAQQHVNSLINNFTTKLNQPALYAASSVELVLAVTTGFDVLISTFWLILRWNLIDYITKVIVFLTVIVFNKFKFDHSQYTKASVLQMDQTWNGYINKINNPKLTQLFFQLRDLAIHYISLIQIPKDVVKKTQ
ncbi:uncharacterized protein KGF55_004139 [Candida pseudojiufengensis]|uniref:uncharacterized protein n=1 Tax=Candida pseudojiufengensis TaxID=497109 RepID=UPI0022247CA4|nr:uncharacterized protein KGF55_004139 [Candida pseudojiufengensis]KAI5961214.1 hypothetical protein KGF55_004139 [Candida pseudojiufengensis]